MRTGHRIGFKQLNNVLLALIVLINLYIIVAPFSPAIVFWYQKNHTNTAAVLAQRIASGGSSLGSLKTTSRQPTHTPPVSGNQVIIPSILLDQAIHEGTETYKALDLGVWRWPHGSTPDRGGNTILIGHRFTYTNPKGVFYELNEIKLGDQIGIIWNGQTYHYQVSAINQVRPNDTAILTQTAQPEITLYTCTPLFNPKYRLVIVANLETKT